MSDEKSLVKKHIQKGVKHCEPDFFHRLIITDQFIATWVVPKNGQLLTELPDPNPQPGKSHGTSWWMTSSHR